MADLVTIIYDFTSGQLNLNVGWDNAICIVLSPVILNGVVRHELCIFLWLSDDYLPTHSEFPLVIFFF